MKKLILLLLASCTAVPNQRNIIDIGGGVDTFTAGAFQYAPSGVGSYGSFSINSNKPSGYNLTGVVTEDQAEPWKVSEGKHGVGYAGGLTYSDGQFGVFAGAALAVHEEYTQYHDANINESGYIVSEDGLAVGVEVGTHLFLSDDVALGIRYNTIWETAIFSLGLSF